MMKCSTGGVYGTGRRDDACVITRIFWVALGSVNVGRDRLLTVEIPKLWQLSVVCYGERQQIGKTVLNMM